MKEERVEYPLSPACIPHWTPVEMLREIIANALDTGAEYRIEFNKNTGLVSVCDKSPGFKKRFLMAGDGEQKTKARIARFKEGLKLAMLVAARNRLRFRLDTTEFIVTRVAIEKTQSGSDGLVVYLLPPESTYGTVVIAEATQKQYDKAVQMFAPADAAGSTTKRAPFPTPRRIITSTAG